MAWDRGAPEGAGGLQKGESGLRGMESCAGVATDEGRRAHRISVFVASTPGDAFPTSQEQYYFVPDDTGELQIQISQLRSDMLLFHPRFSAAKIQTKQSSSEIALRSCSEARSEECASLT